jgi:hypothetical protein
MNSQNLAFVTISGKKAALKKISVKMIFVKVVSVKKTSVKDVKKRSIKKAIKKTNYEIKKIDEKRIILSAEDEKISNF